MTLRLQGYYPDAAALQELATGRPQIEIVKSASYPETLRRMGRALVFAHPSRCDGLARVLIEAMAAGAPTVVSDAGGNSYCIRDGETGLVFPSGNVDELSKCLRQLLADAELRKRMGDRGHELAHTLYTEKVYVDRFAQMVEAANGNDR